MDYELRKWSLEKSLKISLEGGEKENYDLGKLKSVLYLVILFVFGE